MAVHSYSCLEHPHGQLGGLQSRRLQRDMTEQLSMCGDTLNYILVYYNIINIHILEICMQNYLLISSLQ